MATLIVSYCFLKACIIVARDAEPMPEDICWHVAAVIEDARRGVAGHCVPALPIGDRPARLTFMGGRQ